MVTVPESHDVTIGAPWYAPPGDQVAMHRYFDGGFVDRFRSDVANQPERYPTQLFGWKNDDLITDPDTGAAVLKLRRPMHRTFYMVAWEAGCLIPNALTVPAISPRKIESAGFVIRQGDSNRPYTFQIKNGKPVGWSQTFTQSADPDAARQLKSLGLVPSQAAPAPAYTGEETYPLHPLLLQNAGRSRTVLFGYLPLGGAHYVPNASTTASAEPGSLPDDVPWPYGLMGITGDPPPYSDNMDLQIAAGQIQPLLAAALAVMLGRYQLVEAGAWSDSANSALVDVLDQISFFTVPAPSTEALSSGGLGAQTAPLELAGQALRNYAQANASGLTLGSVLQSAAASGTGTSPNETAANELLTALMSATPPGSAVPLPASIASLVPADSQNLVITQAAAASLRGALQTLLSNASNNLGGLTNDLPVPKLTAGPAGRYFIVPFVRTVKPDGCKRIYWGTPSAPFAVATAFDPDASRPTLIEMPDIADAKKGLAKGATFLLPPALADLVNGLTSKDAVNNMIGGSGPPAVGIRFICSFSLPVIMICAMLLLSMVISLLNIFLQWIAFVKICLPVPAPKSPPP